MLQCKCQRPDLILFESVHYLMPANLNELKQFYQVDIIQKAIISSYSHLKGIFHFTVLQDIFSFSLIASAFIKFLHFAHKT